MLLGLWTRMGPSNHVLDGVQILMGRGNLRGEGQVCCKLWEIPSMCGGSAAFFVLYFDHLFLIMQPEYMAWCSVHLTFVCIKIA